MTTEGYKHLVATFEQAERLHPDLMEPFGTLLAETKDAGERTKIMRHGLASTFRRRFPMSENQWWFPEYDYAGQGRGSASAGPDEPGSRADASGAHEDIQSQEE